MEDVDEAVELLTALVLESSHPAAAISVALEVRMKDSHDVPAAGSASPQSRRLTGTIAVKSRQLALESTIPNWQFTVATQAATHSPRANALETDDVARPVPSIASSPVHDDTKKRPSEPRETWVVVVDPGVPLGQTRSSARAHVGEAYVNHC